LGEVIPAPIPLKTAKALRQQLDDAPSMTAAADGTERAYDGKRVMKGKKRASLVASAVGEEGTKRQTRGKQVKYNSGDVGGDDDDDEEEFNDGGNTSEGGEMDVDD
jgi:hypothetical protein